MVLILRFHRHHLHGDFFPGTQQWSCVPATHPQLTPAIPTGTVTVMS
ncbi:hypothetical protein [Brachymonas sp.]